MRLALELLGTLAICSCSARQEDPFLAEAHNAVSMALGSPDKTSFSEQPRFIFREFGLVCGKVRTENAPEQVYAYQKGEVAAVGHSLRYDEMYGRCHAVLEARDRKARTDAEAKIKR